MPRHSAAAIRPRRQRIAASSAPSERRWQHDTDLPRQSGARGCRSARTICAKPSRSAATAPRRPRNRPRKAGSARSTRPPTPSNGAPSTASRSRSSSAGTSPTTAIPDKEGRPTAKPMLAVTRLPPGAVCHVAYVDAQANPNPNELARKAADDLARNFKCGKDEVKVIGETGRAVSMAKRSSRRAWRSSDTRRRRDGWFRALDQPAGRGPVTLLCTSRCIASSRNAPCLPSRPRRPRVAAPGRVSRRRKTTAGPQKPIWSPKKAGRALAETGSNPVCPQEYSLQSITTAILIDHSISMWFPIIAWIVLFSASAFFAGATLGLDPGQISIQFSALPGPQRFALAAIMLTTLSLIGSSVWQAYSLARQNNLLRDRLRGLRQGVLAAHDAQTRIRLLGPAPRQERPRRSHRIASDDAGGHRENG